MGMGPTEMMNVPSSTPYVTKLKSKILFRMDYVLTCENDEAALNGWRLLCADGIVLVRMALEEGRLDELKNAKMWNKLAQDVIDKWPFETAEKTSVIMEGDGYRCEYDGYCVEMRNHDLELGLRSLEREKYNVINSALASIWGDCYSIAMVAEYLNLEEQIELPVHMGDEYTKDKMRHGIGRHTPVDGQRGNSKAQDVEGGAHRQ